jgi:hypothetical protein
MLLGGGAARMVAANKAAMEKTNFILQVDRGSWMIDS